MTGPVSTRIFAPSRSTILATRRWFAIPLLLALLGATCGLAAGSFSRGSAQALLLVRANATDGTNRAAENAALELNTQEIFSAAAEKTGVDAADLRRRSTIATEPNSQIVSITVSAPTAEQAVTDADAVAGAGMDAGTNRTPKALEQLTKSTRDLIESEDLNNDSAERARVARLGEELGASQAALVAEASRLQLLQTAEPYRRLPGQSVLALMGALGGALIGVAIALLIGVRRGTVRSARELTELYPRTAVINSAELQQALEMESGAHTVIVAAAPGTRLSGVSETVRQTLHAVTGKQVLLLDSLASANIGNSPDGHINLVTTRLTETVLRRAIRDRGTVLIVPVHPNITKLKTVDEFASRLSDRSYLLVDPKAPEWH